MVDSGSGSSKPLIAATDPKPHNLENATDPRRHDVLLKIIQNRLPGNCALIIDKIQRIFGTNRFNSLLLEVFAIFLGISASFAIEEWREDRQEKENFERYLHAIYFDALREEALARRFVSRGNQAVAAINTLLNKNIAILTDDELLSLVGTVFRNWSLPSSDGSYRALMASGISLPFDDTMQALNASYERRSIARIQLDTQMADHNRMVNFVRSQTGAVSNPPTVVHNEDHTISEGNRFDQPSYQGIRKLFFRDGTFLLSAESARLAREAILQPEYRHTLNAESERIMQAMDSVLLLAESSYRVREAIREKIPDLRLTIRSLRLVGDATPTGWSEVDGLSLHHEGENSDWWSAKIELADGTVKFVANETWGASWGAPMDWNHVDPLTPHKTYLGDPDEVFPSGVAEFDGLDVPVVADRYAVRFNIHTFEDSFTSLKK